MASFPGARGLSRAAARPLRLAATAGALIAWACLPACAAESTTAPGIATEPGLRSALDEIEAPYEKACRQLGLARWELIQNPVAGSIRRYSEARARIGDIFSSDGLERVLREWAPRDTVTSDPTLTRRVRLWNKARRGVLIEADPRVFRLSTELVRRMLGHAYMWRGEPAGRATLDRIIASEPDPSARRAAWAARLGLASAVAGDMRELVRARALLARNTPSLYYHHVVMEADDLRPDWLYTVLEVLSRRTNPAYEKLLSSLQEVAGTPALRPWDIDFAMNRLSARREVDAIERKYFPASKLAPVVDGLLESLGFDPDELDLELVGSDSFSGASGVAISIPDDYRIVVGGLAGGADLYEETLRAVGRGLLAVLNERPAPMLKGYDCAPGTRNGPFAEAMAETLAGFLYDPLFLETRMKMKPEEIRLFIQDRLDRRLIEFRRQILGSGMAYVLYINPDADLDGRYATLHLNALRIPVEGDLAASWPGDLEIVTNPVHAPDSIVGAAIGRELHRKLAAEFGDRRLGSGRAAAYLIERCFRDGEDLPLEQRLARAIDSGYEFERFTDWLTGVPAGPDRP